MEAPKSYEDLQAEADEIQKELELRRTVIDEQGKEVNTDETPKWKHRTVEFYGEDWEVRKPTPEALGAFSLASGKYIKGEMQNNMVGLFIKNHMSEASHERLYERMMDSDDDFSFTQVGELMQLIATLGTSRPTALS